MGVCIIKSFMFMGTKATEAAKKAKIPITAVTLRFPFHGCKTTPLPCLHSYLDR